MYVKIIVMGILIVVSMKSIKLGEEQIEYFSNLSRTSSTQSEIRRIQRLIYSEHVTFNDHQLPGLSESQWTDYIKNAMRNSDPNRDTSKDLWGKQYRVRATTDLAEANQKAFEVRSAGPDSIFDTKDDIVSLCKL